jgi:hypothetical protein
LGGNDVLVSPQQMNTSNYLIYFDFFDQWLSQALYGTGYCATPGLAV